MSSLDNFYNQKIVIFIPVRMNSKRLPGKPLFKINNLPLLHHTYNQVLNNITNFNNTVIYILTSDQEIINYCNISSIPYINTSIPESNNIRNGTDRCAFAIKHHLNILPKDTIIVNVQGDNYILPNNFLTTILNCFNNNQVYWGTLVTDLSSKDILCNDVVKAYIDPNTNYITCFYRNLGVDQEGDCFLLNSKDFYKHIGIYAYKNYFLEQFYNLETSVNEIKFNLEQLRGLDNNYKIMSEYTEYNSISIDNFSQLFKFNTN